MKLQDLLLSKNLILQILWGEKTIEFSTDIVDRDENGLYITPYLYNGAPLSLSINVNSGVVCNFFGDNPDDGTRVSWRNIELDTVSLKNQTVYYIKTSSYNSEARVDDRRVEDRVKVTKDAELYDSVAKKTVQIRIHDVSDSGIAFHAPLAYEPMTKSFSVKFSDEVNGHVFNINIKCKTVRTKEMVGTCFYGCKLSDENNDYLLYGCLKRLEKGGR